MDTHLILNHDTKAKKNPTRLRGLFYFSPFILKFLHRLKEQHKHLNAFLIFDALEKKQLIGIFPPVHRPHEHFTRILLVADTRNNYCNYSFF